MFSLIRSNGMIKFYIGVAYNNVREKEILKYTISCNVFKHTYGYDPLIEIYPCPKTVQFIVCIDGIYHCVTFFCK